MYVPFEQLSPDSRVWVYMSNRSLNKAERTKIEAELKTFCSQWEAHKNGLLASFEILDNQIIVLGADQTHHPNSGCSIDASVRVLKNLQDELGLNFFDRLLVLSKSESNVETYSLSQFRANKELHKNTVFNSLINVKKELDHAWLPFTESPFSPRN